MASISDIGAYGHHNFTLTVTEGTPNNTANTSTVSFTFKISPVATNWNWNSWGDSITFTVTINGEKYTGSIPSYDGCSTVTLKKGSLPVVHGDDGSKTISYSFSVDDDANGKNSSGEYYTPGDASANGTLELTTIPRATSIDSLTAATSYLNAKLTYEYTPKSASYYNRVNISLNLSGTYIAIRSINLGKKATSQQTDDVTFTDAELTDIYKRLPSTTKGKIRFTLRTYSDSGYSNKIGSAGYKEVELTIPTTVKPTVSLAVEMLNDNAWISEKGIYVAGYSKARLAATATAGSGSSLASINISGGGINKNESALTAQFAASGDFTFTAKATDKRGRYATNKKKITVLPYSVPSLTSLQFQRGTYASGAWTAKNDGPDIKVAFKAALALSGNGNAYAATFKLNGTAVTPGAGATSGLVSDAENAVYLTAVSTNRSYLLELSIKDSVGETGGGSLLIPSKNITVAYNKKTGKGIAFGKTSEMDEGFECAWPAEFSNTVTLIREDGSTYEIGDTGWIELGLSANVSAKDGAFGHAGSGCKYRVVNGNHVYVAFACDAAYSGSQLVVNAEMIPEEYRPTRHIYGFGSTGGRSIGRIIVNYSGQILIDYLQQITASSNTTSLTTWIDGYIDYWLD